MSKIILKFNEKWLKPENLKILRKITNLGYSDISEKIRNKKPVAEFLLFLNNYAEIEKLLTEFIFTAEKKLLTFEIYEIGEDEIYSEIESLEKFKITSQMLISIFESSKETIKLIQAEDDAKFF